MGSVSNKVQFYRSLGRGRETSVEHGPLRVVTTPTTGRVFENPVP